MDLRRNSWFEYLNANANTVHNPRDGVIRAAGAESTSCERRVDKTIYNSFLLSRGFRNTSIIFLLALNLILRLWLVLQPLQYTDGTSIPDDAYLSLTLARNIAHGLGPSYAGETTSGFQPLFVFLMVPVYFVVSNDAVLPVHIASGLSSIFDTVTLFLLCRIVARRSRSALVIYPVALAWILNPVGIRIATNGMETSMACFFLTWALFIINRDLIDQRTGSTWRVSLSVGLVVGVGMVARIDNIVVGMVAVASTLAFSRDDLRRGFQNVLVVVFGVLLIYFPWLAYSYSTTGDLYPVSGKAVRLMSLATVDFTPTFQNWYALMLQAGVEAVARINMAVLVVSAATLIARVFSVRGLDRRIWGKSVWLAPAIVYSLLLFSAYTLYVFGPWFFDRYLFPTEVVFVLTLSALLNSYLEMLKREFHRTCVIVVAALLVVMLDLADPEFGRTFIRTDASSIGYMNIGLWAKREFTPGTVIGSAQSGALGYFADSLKVINLDGVVSKSCYESLLHFKGLSYLRGRHVQYIVGWYSNFQYLEHQSVGLSKSDLSDLRKIEGVQTWGYDWFLAKVRY